jgi:hypothetical protein
MIIRGELNLMILCGYLFLDISLIEGGLSESVLKKCIVNESSL